MASQLRFNLYLDMWKPQQCGLFAIALVALFQWTANSVNAEEETPAVRAEIAAAKELFATKIKPLFAQKCGACHGESAKEIKGEFDLRTRAALLQGGESGEPAINFEKPNASLLLAALRWEDGLEMPPKENDRLSVEQIGWVRRWIKAGAPWPSDVELTANSNDQSWSEPDAEGAVRIVTSGGTTSGWTNRRYASEDLWAYQPIQSIDVPWSALSKHQPRHPIDAFIQRRLNEAKIEPAPLADPRTLARRTAAGLTGLPPNNEVSQKFIADSSPAAYADWLEHLLDSPHHGERMAQHWLDVVRYADTNGFARDDFRPAAHQYRTYVIESFNADKPFDRFIKEQIAGDELKLAGQDALSFLWMGPWEHTAMSVAAVTRQQWLDDVTNSIGVTFLGHQLRCASCHDHKFDPIPTRDYYSMQAVFASTKHNVKAGEFKVTDQKAAPSFILTGGALDSPADPVTPGALSLLAATADHQFTNPQDQSPRATLANWVSDAKNPLTPRVIVNRVWQMHFGRGIVATPNDFGKMGADPTHPELLDWLANWFIENGWSVKKLHRLILTSNTYQRSGSHPNMARVQEVDPANQLLSYFPVRRLSAEEIRDNMLAITGELNREVGGPSVYPEINWEVAFQPRLLMGKIALPYQPDSKRAKRNRRSIYAVRIRNLGHPFMEVLNRPGSELSCDRRDETTVTPQAFTMLHGEFVHERALALADRIMQKTKSPAKQIEQAFVAVYGRLPTDAEKTFTTAHLAKMTKLHEAHRIEPQPLPTEVTLENVAEKTGEPQKITFPLKNLENYEEDLKPWDVGPKTRALADVCLALLNSSEFLYVY